MNENAELFLADGGVLLGARLTPDLIPLLAWDPHFQSKGAAIGPASAPRFKDTMHHLSLICPKVASSSSDMANETLARSVEAIARDITTASRILKSLEACWNPRDDATGETGELRAVLERLERVSGDCYTSLYRSIRAAYPVLPRPREDLETLQQLVKLDNDAVEIFQTQRYLAEANVPTAGFPNLAVDRDTLLTGLLPSRLARSRGRGWSAIARDAEGFRIRYTQAYREHHQRFHDGLPKFQAELIGAKKKLAALYLLNTIGELGPPAGTSLALDLEALPQGPCPCSLQGTKLDLANEPYCTECRISLEQTVPTTELARLAPQIDMALGAKTQELSRLLVEKALAGRSDEHWQEFLQIVQASELSSLANTLDSDLVSFIRQVLD